MTAEELEHPEQESFDRIAQDLQRLRIVAGGVSYAEIVRRIAKLREARGVPTAAARPGRTTVYDAFRQGRSRMNTDLVCEIAEVLGANEAEVTGWRTRCHAAAAQSSLAAATSRPESEPQAEREPSLEPEPLVSAQPMWARRHPIGMRTLLTTLCLGINVVGYAVVAFLHLPLYLDMIGTGLAAIALGPWYGVLVAVLASAFGYSIDGPAAFPLVVVSVTGALVWSYGVRKLGCGRSLTRYFALNVAVAVVCSLIATPVLMLFFNGGTGHLGDSVTQTIADMGEPEFLSVLQGNLMLSIADKLLSGFIILVALNAIGPKLPISGADPFVRLQARGGAR